MTAKYGIELEGWAYRRKLTGLMPVDVSEVLPRLTAPNGVPVTGNIFRESGTGSIEFAGFAAPTVAEAVDNILNLHRRAAEHRVPVIFSCKSPYPDWVHEGVKTLEVAKSRFLAIVEASRREVAEIGGSEEDHRRLHMQNFFAALHLHASFEGLPVTRERVAEEMIFVNDVLNLLGPRIAKVLCRKYGVDNAGHLGIFSGWAAPYRFSQYGQWFGSFEGMLQRLSRMTRFITCVEGTKEDGTWAPDLVTPMQWNDHDVAELGIWHMSRLRTRQGTIEVRFMPSVPLEYLPDVAHDIAELVQYLVEIAPSRPYGAGGNVDEFMESRLWTALGQHEIGGQADWQPRIYTKELWQRDVFG